MEVILATLIQFSGFFLVFGSIYFAIIVSTDATVHYYILHKPSAVLVFVGLLGVALSLANYRDLLQTLWALIKAPPSYLRKQLRYATDIGADLMSSYYAEGGSGVRRTCKVENLPVVWEQILSQLEAKVPIDDIRLLVRRYATEQMDTYENHKRLLRTLKASAPTIGMFGTVLGLVKLLTSLKDFSNIGPDMSLALITTLYGIFVSILVDPLISHIENKQNFTTKALEHAYFILGMIKDKKPSFYAEEHILRQGQQ